MPESTATRKRESERACAGKVLEEKNEEKKNNEEKEKDK